MNEIKIRKARFSDLNSLLVFEQAVIETERPFDPTLKSGKINYYNIEMMISANHIELLVAEINNELVGSGYARIEEAKPYLHHPKHSYLGFMYVKPAHRGKGINKLIIDELINWSVSNNINELRLDVYQPNESAISAYKKAGFTEHMIEMRRGIN